MAFLLEIDERASDEGVIRDEVTIEAHESQECSNVSDALWVGPIRHALDFCWVHLEGAVFQDNAQEFHVFLLKETLLWFEEKIVFLQLIQDAMDCLSVARDVVVHMD